MALSEPNPHVSPQSDRMGRGWSRAALITAAGIWLLAFPTWGLSILLAPVGAPPTIVAWWRSRHDAVFWTGAGLNAANALGFVGFIVGILTRDVSIGLE